MKGAALFRALQQYVKGSHCTSQHPVACHCQGVEALETTPAVAVFTVSPFLRNAKEVMNHKCDSELTRPPVPPSRGLAVLLQNATGGILRVTALPFYRRDYYHFCK